MKRRAIRRRSLPADTPAGLTGLLGRVYAARGVRSVEEVDYALERVLPPDGLLGIGEAGSLLAAAVQRGERIVVVGDFDADGATSCAVVVRALRAFGGVADFVVPNRFECGHGLSPAASEQARAKGARVLMTVDTGIASEEGVRAARAAEMRVLVTDHHLPGERLPDADVIVNPNRAGDGFPSKALCGVGVAWYVMAATRAALREAGWFAGRGIEPPNMAQWLDLVALGTVADVAALDRNNRLLVEQGLKRIRAGRASAGIRALLECAGRRIERCLASDLGFAVAPRINAAGRLADLTLGVRCLLTDDAQEAGALAAELDALNRERRGIEAGMRAQAETALQTLALSEDSLPAGLCLFHDDWHEGVIGILAGRIKERWHRPVIAFAPTGEGLLRGSARSVAGVHIRDVLERIAAGRPGLIRRFGGHAMAAGLTIEREVLGGFRGAFAEAVAQVMPDPAGQAVLWTDGPLAPEEYRIEVAERLRDAGPWGQAFPEPVFDDVFEPLDSSVVGERHRRWRLRHLASGAVLEGIEFNADAPPAGAGRVHAAFRIDVDEFRGQRRFKLIIETLRAVP